MDFGGWTPDIVPFSHGGLVTARNVYPALVGYKPVKQLSALTEAVPEDWRGGSSFIASDGTVATLAGTDGGLYAYASGAWSSITSGTYSGPWRFAQWSSGGYIIATNGLTPVKYDLAAGTGADLGGSPPDSTMIAIVRDFVFLAGDPAHNGTVSWCDVAAPETWTPGTGQADSDQIPDGGPITGLAGGEFGLVFQENAIHRYTYVGGDVVFQRDKVAEGIGCITPGAVAQFGRTIYFVSPRGFYAWADDGLKAIGRDKVDRTFVSMYRRDDIVKYMRCIVDPTRALVLWSMPDRIWVYNWELDRWTEIYIPGVLGLATGINPSVSLEGIDTLYPGGIETVPGSLDDPIYQGGAQMLTLVKSDNVIYTFGSSYNMQAILRLPLLEYNKGRDTRIRSFKLYGDMVDGATVSIDYLQRLGDVPKTVTESTLYPNGGLPIRVTGRYLQPQVIIAEGTIWSYMTGYELYQHIGGGR